jgi:sugar lactone lactonase YvrE/ribosomal protein L30E
LRTFEFINQGGVGSPIYNYTITVTGPPSNTAPTFTTQPTSQAVTVGTSVTFTAAADGTPAPTYQWKKENVNISGATNSTFTIASVAAGDAGSYTIVATNSAGSATSNAAMLTVNPAPVAPAITSHPASQTVTLGSSVTFTAAASGSPTPTYQWRKNSTNINGATGTSYTITAVATADSGSYTVVATNTAGSATSNAATLTTVASRLVDGTVTTGHSVIFSAGTASGSIQWQVSNNNGSTWTNLANGGPYSGVTTASLGITNADASLNGLKYRFVATDNGSVSNSPAVGLTVAPALLPFPTSIVVDSSGNLFVGDANANTIQKITTTGIVTLVAGTNGTAGADNGTGAAARFNQPNGLTLINGGTITVSDTANATIRSITTAGVVTTVAGSSTIRGNADGAGASATFSSPIGITNDGTSALYIADAMNDTIRKIAVDGTVSTLAGSPGVTGSTNATGAAARFNFPSGITVDTNGNIYVADTTNNLIRKITSAGAVTTLAGVPSVAGFDDGTGSGALFHQPEGLAVDSTGNLYLADTANSTIRKITPAGVVTTIAGLPTISGLEDGSGMFALFKNPQALCVDANGNIFVADTGNATIRKINPAGDVITLTLTAGGPPAFTTQPASQTVNVGANVTFTAVASGSPAPTYQWQKGSANIAGATSASYSISNVSMTDAGSYTVIATNSIGAATSTAATLTVNAVTPPPMSSSSSGGGGGGGAPSLWFLAALPLLSIGRRLFKRNSS